MMEMKADDAETEKMETTCNQVNEFTQLKLWLGATAE